MCCIKCNLTKFIRWFKTSSTEQLKTQWLTIVPTIILTIIGLYLTFSYNNQQQTKYSSPLFKYDYDRDKATITQDVGNDFSSFLTMWLIPEADSTTTGYQSSNLTLNRVIGAIINHQDIYHGANLNPFYPYNSNEWGYIKCEILGVFGPNSTSTFSGFPIGVETYYVIRGEVKASPKPNYDIVLLKDLTNDHTGISTLQNLPYDVFRQFLQKNGTAELERVMRIDPYDKNRQYLNDDKSCRQTNDEYSEILLK